MKHQALVINCSRNGLGIIRALGRAGFSVYAADHFNNLGLYSRYIDKRYLVRPIDEPKEAFVQDLISIWESVCKTGKMFLIPTNDIYVDFFANNWALFDDYFIPVFETDTKVLHANINKTSMYRLAESAGIHYPRTFYSLDSAKEAEFPLIVKPDQKRTTDVLNSVFRIAICNNHRELEQAVNTLTSGGASPVIQTYIPGGDDQLFTAGVWSYKGELKAMATGRKIRQFPPSIGQCSFGELVRAEDLTQSVKSFLKYSGITGICQLEFKKFKGRYYLMEINPRAWSWNSLFDFAGVNLPLAACKDILNHGKEDFVAQKKFEGTWMFFEQDIWHNVIKNQNVPLWQFVKDFLRADKRAHFSVTDPLPYFVFIYLIIQKKILA